MTLFKSTSAVLWLGREKEKRILESCRNHMGKVVEVVEEMRKTFHAFCKLDIKKSEEHFKKVFDQEKEADEIKRSILKELSSGLFHPINREEIIRLILTADDIAANAKSASRKLSYVPPEKLTESLRGLLSIFADNLLKITLETSMAFEELTKDPQLAIEASSRVESLEEKIDELRVESVMPEFLLWCNELKETGLCLILKEIINGMENLADRCEDVADVIRSIVISSV